jgi:hypothetical protein
MYKIISFFSIFLFQITVSAQNPAGEYVAVANAELTIIENVKIVIKCDSTFKILDSAIEITGKWYIDHKSMLVLSCDSIQPVDSINPNNKQVKLYFDFASDRLIWSKSAIQDFQNLKLRRDPITKIEFNKKKWRDNKLVKSLSYQPCS